MPKFIGQVATSFKLLSDIHFPLEGVSSISVSASVRLKVSSKVMWRMADHEGSDFCVAFTVILCSTFRFGKI